MRVTVPLIALAAISSSALSAARSVVVRFHNETEVALTLVGSGFTGTGYGEWVTKPPQTVPAQATAQWKCQSSMALKGVGGYAIYSMPGHGNVSLGWDSPYVGNNSYKCSVGAPFAIEKAGGTGDNATVTFTLAPPFALPSNVQINRLAIRVLTGQDLGAATDDEVYFDIGPLGWKLDKANYKDFRRYGDDTYDLPIPDGVQLNTDDITRLRLQKKGIGGWLGAVDGAGGEWECESIHLIVNGKDLRPILVNKWFKAPSSSQQWSLGIHPKRSAAETFVRTLRMTPNPTYFLGGGPGPMANQFMVLSSSGVLPVFKPSGELDGPSRLWLFPWNANLGYVKVVGTLVRDSAASGEMDWGPSWRPMTINLALGFAVMDLKVESVEVYDTSQGYQKIGTNVMDFMPGATLAYIYNFTPGPNPYKYVFGKTSGIDGQRYIRAQQFFNFGQQNITTGQKNGLRGNYFPTNGQRVMIEGPLFVATDAESSYEIHPRQVVFPYTGP